MHTIFPLKNKSINQSLFPWINIWMSLKQQWVYVGFWPLCLLHSIHPLSVPLHSSSDSRAAKLTLGGRPQATPRKGVYLLINHSSLLTTSVFFIYVYFCRSPAVGGRQPCSQGTLSAAVRWSDSALCVGRLEVWKAASVKVITQRQDAISVSNCSIN